MICTKCKTDYPVTEYHKNKNRTTGLSAWCKSCCHKNMQMQYPIIREEVILKSKQYAKDHPEQRKETLNRYSKKIIDGLEDEYVRKQLFKTSNIPYLDIPKELIDVERERLRIVRYLRRLNNE